MRCIEPVYQQYWDDVSEEMVETGELVGYRVVGDTGTVLGIGETREEALANARERVLLPG